MDQPSTQLECARQIVHVLLDKTGLSAILPAPPNVVVGGGNWISFTFDRPLSRQALRALAGWRVGFAFVPRRFRGRARSATSPSLHLKNLDSGQPLRGHVDSHYWPRSPLAHALEFFTKITVPPSDLWKRL